MFSPSFPAAEIYEAVVGPHVVRVRGVLPDWAPTLAAVFFDYLGGKTNAAYVADVVKLAHLFDPAWDIATCRERITRMLVEPVQVDGFLLSLLSVEPTKRSMYQKTKRLDLRRGELATDGPVREWHHEADLPTTAKHAVPLRSLVEELEDFVRTLAQRVDTLERRLGEIETEMLC